MKCPKCGYNSFEIHDTCKKCSYDLTSYKETHGLKAIVLPHEARAVMAEQFMTGQAEEAAVETANAQADMFSFDTSEAAPAVASGSFHDDDPFNFDLEHTSTTPETDAFSFGDEAVAAQAKADEDAFSSLLEATSQKEDDAFSAPLPAAAASSDISEPDSFSWDDTPIAASGNAVSDNAVKSGDDFDDLFGDANDSVKK